MSNIIIKERPDTIYCHKCDTNSPYVITHGSSGERTYDDVFELNAHLSVYCKNCSKEILSVTAGAYSDKLDRD